MFDAAFDNGRTESRDCFWIKVLWQRQAIRHCQTKVRRLRRFAGLINHEMPSRERAVEKQHVKMRLTGLGVSRKNVRDCIRFYTTMPQCLAHHVDRVGIGHIVTDRKMDGHHVANMLVPSQFAQDLEHRVPRPKRDRGVKQSRDLFKEISDILSSDALRL